MILIYNLWMQREIGHMECAQDGGVEALQLVATRTCYWYFIAYLTFLFLFFITQFLGDYFLHELKIMEYWRYLELLWSGFGFVRHIKMLDKTKINLFAIIFIR